MMAQELVNENGISAIALAFFSTMIPLLIVIAKGVFDTRATSRDARQEASNASRKASKAVESAEAAQQNTQSVSNGFTSDVLGALRRVETKIDKQTEALQNHLEWHLQERK